MSTWTCIIVFVNNVFHYIMIRCNFKKNECGKNKLLKHFKDIIVHIFELLSSLQDWKCFKNDINI
jgi:hypothetical protein